VSPSRLLGQQSATDRQPQGYRQPIGYRQAGTQSRREALSQGAVVLYILYAYIYCLMTCVGVLSLWVMRCLILICVLCGASLVSRCSMI
jgi:hypothetical protein